MANSLEEFCCNCDCHRRLTLSKPSASPFLPVDFSFPSFSSFADPELSFSVLPEEAITLKSVLGSENKPEITEGGGGNEDEKPGGSDVEVKEGIWHSGFKYIGPTKDSRPRYKSKQVWQYDIYPHGVSRQPNGKLRVQIKRQGLNPTCKNSPPQIDNRYRSNIRACASLVLTSSTNGNRFRFLCQSHNYPLHSDPAYNDTYENLLKAALFRDRESLRLLRLGVLKRMPKLNFQHPDFDPLEFRNNRRANADGPPSLSRKRRRRRESKANISAVKERKLRMESVDSVTFMGSDTTE
eukprot:325279-Amorphochlora_amoeboformis.AAC.2